MKIADLINLLEAGGCLTPKTEKTAGKALKIQPESDYY